VVIIYNIAKKLVWKAIRHFNDWWFYYCLIVFIPKLGLEFMET
jgi:hypothetical protein